MFSGGHVLLDSKDTELGSNDQEASPSAVKKSGVVLVPRLRMEARPAATWGGVDISDVPGCHLL